MLKKALRVLLLCLTLSTPWAMAQAEPSMSEVYAAAQAGQMDKAQAMIQQVLVSHPNSAKAHYVRAELFAREGKARLAQESLQEAERLSPGLHFAKPESVSALKAQIGQLSAQANTARPAPTQAAVSQPAQSNNIMWLVLAGGAVLLVIWAVRSRQQAASAATYPAPYPAATPSGNVLNGPQSFGQPASAGYPHPSPEPGMGSRIMGGVATGLAVGAGVMAAEAIGRRLMDHDDSSGHGHGASPGVGTSGGDYIPMNNTNADMGGSNFGVTDGGGWDDGGDAGGGSDWDN
jgi:hypothetical protein